MNQAGAQCSKNHQRRLPALAQGRTSQRSLGPNISSVLLLACLLFTAALLADSASALDSAATLAKAYNNHDYGRVVQEGQTILQKDPNNVKVRYYMANSYLELKQMEEARLQYQQCIRLAPNSELARNSSTALAGISRYLQAAGSPADRGNKQKQKHRHRKGNPTNPDEQRIWDEAQEHISIKQNDADRQIEKIRRQANEDISSIPSRSYTINRRGRMRGHKNRILSSGKSAVNADANEKIAKIKAAFQKEKQDILNEAKRRITGQTAGCQEHGHRAK